MPKCVELLPCDWLISNVCYQAIEQVYLIKWPVGWQVKYIYIYIHINKCIHICIHIIKFTDNPSCKVEPVFRESKYYRVMWCGTPEL